MATASRLLLRAGLGKVGLQGVWRVGLIYHPQADSAWSGVVNPGKTASVGDVREGVSTETVAADPLALSRKPYNPVSPCIAPVCSEPLSLCWNTGLVATKEILYADHL